MSDETLEAIRMLGFVKMTPVQASTVPLFLKNKDVCVEATTGSGKTLAFGIPCFEILKRSGSELRKHDVGALIVAPTRELAAQIHDVLSKLSEQHKSIQCRLFVGGTSVDECSAEFDEFGAQIVIGTPGRIIDIQKRSVFMSFKKLEVTYRIIGHCIDDGDDDEEGCR